MINKDGNEKAEVESKVTQKTKVKGSLNVLVNGK